MISKTSKILLISLLFIGASIQQEAAKNPNCAEDFTQPADKKDTGCKDCKSAFAPHKKDIPQATGWTFTECIPCPGKCQSCTLDNNGAPTDCTGCDEVHGLNTATPKRCEPCADANCQQCQANKDECATCKTGFGVKPDKKCEECTKIENCLKCEKAGECTECKPEFGLKDDKKCGACPANCRTCDKDLKCTACKTSFYLDAAVKDCKTCPDNCFECDAKDSCTICRSGYFLHQNKCITACPTGTTAINRMCVTCGDNCVQCGSFDACSRCSDGFYAVNGKCTTCPGSCASCDSAGKCTACQAGTNLNGDGTCSASRWYQKWWFWTLVTLAAIGLLAACASMLGKAGSSGTRQYAGYQQYDGNTSYAARSQYEMNASQQQF